MLVPEDIPELQASLLEDEEHPDLTSDFFTEHGTITSVYGDDAGPACYVRGSKTLRLDIHWCDNSDAKRNMKIMLQGFNALAERAAENGFKEIIFQTNSPLLRLFCVKRFGFVDSANELRKEL